MKWRAVPDECPEAGFYYVRYITDIEGLAVVYGDNYGLLRLDDILYHWDQCRSFLSEIKGPTTWA